MMNFIKLQSLTLINDSFILLQRICLVGEYESIEK